MMVGQRRHLVALPNTSSREHFSRSVICWSRPRVALCSHRSIRKMVDGGSPIFLENWANVISPRCCRRNLANFLSSADGTGLR
jgi:hypothetical protein